MKVADLVSRAWRLYQAADLLVVKPSTPILWFGDSKRYAESALRIVTVGLNPSFAEFPKQDPFLRFAELRALDPVSVDGSEASYMGALDGYFRNEPYRRWFDQGFERILHGLEASYYVGRLNTAIHTDLLTPLATNPTWSRLAAHERSRLASDGIPLWHDLMRAFEPDVILISVARHHLDAIEFRRLGSWRVVHSVERERPFLTEAIDIEVVPDKRSMLVFGRCVSLPFGSVSYAAKAEIGAAIGRDRA